MSDGIRTRPSTPEIQCKTETCSQLSHARKRCINFAKTNHLDIWDWKNTRTSLTENASLNITLQKWCTVMLLISWWANSSRDTQSDSGRSMINVRFECINIIHHAAITCNAHLCRYVFTCVFFSIQRRHGVAIFCRPNSSSTLRGRKDYSNLVPKRLFARWLPVALVTNSHPVISLILITLVNCVVIYKAKSPLFGHCCCSKVLFRSLNSRRWQIDRRWATRWLSWRHNV